MIGISSSWLATKGYNIKSSVDKIFNLGFELAELGAAHKYEPRAIDVVKNLKKKYTDKRFTVHGLFPPLDQFYMVNIADPKNLQKNIGVLKAIFQVGEIVGADVIGLHGGYKGELEKGEDQFGFNKFKFSKRIEENVGRRTVEEMVEIGVGLAENSGIKFCIETDVGSSLDGYMVRPEDFKWLFSKFDSKQLGVLADIGHIHLSAKKFGFDEYSFVESFKDKIFEMHIHDCTAKGDSHIAAGVGIMNFEKYFQSIGPRIKEIPLVFEYTNRVSIEDTLKSKAYVENLIKRIK